MATIKYAKGFFEDAGTITSEKLQEELKRTLLAVTDFPEMGSPRIARSIREKYGNNTRKMVVGPFDLIYEFNKPEDTVVVYALMPTRAAW